jgi:hypothetical protein
MVKGHLDQSRKNLRSTTGRDNSLPVSGTKSVAIDSDLDSFPQREDSGLRNHHCFAAVMQDTEEGKIFTNRTGCFIVPSSTGNNYLLVLDDYDSNYIHAPPMKSRSASEILQAYKISTKILVQAGLKPQLQCLNNKCSEGLKEYMRDEHVNFQLVPQGVHRRNAAERAIRTFKNHFIAALCSTDKEFPLHLWDQLLPQALIRLNLLRGSRINPKLSAWAQVNGQFDYNRTPLAPPGTRVLVHEKSSARDSWFPHGIDGWYIGPALESYRCFKVWIWDIRNERVCDTLE